MMEARVTSGRLGLAGALQQLASANPTWWCLVASAAAWAFMIVHGVEHWGHARHHFMAMPEELLHWTVMIVAMMVPFVLDPLRLTLVRSLRLRRVRAMGLFLVGFLFV